MIAADYLGKVAAQWKINAEEDLNTPRQVHMPESFLRDLAKL